MHQADERGAITEDEDEKEEFDDDLETKCVVSLFS